MKAKFAVAALMLLSLMQIARADWSCPLFPIHQYEDGTTLYVAWVRPGDCDTRGHLGLAIGQNAEWPARSCPDDCFNIGGTSRLDQPDKPAFAGLERPVSFDFKYVDTLPVAVKPHIRALVDPTIPYLEFVRSDNTPCFAKVLTLAIQWEDQNCKCEDKTRTRLVHVAFQVAAVPDDEKIVTVCCEPLSEQEPYAYSATYELALGQPTSILVLTAR